jgi:hypothetical protein
MKRSLVLLSVSLVALGWAVLCPLGDQQITWAENCNTSGNEPNKQCVELWNGVGPACETGNNYCRWARTCHPDFVFCENL